MHGVALVNKSLNGKEAEDAPGERIDVAVIVKPADLSGAALEHLLASFDDDDLPSLLAYLEPATTAPVR